MKRPPKYPMNHWVLVNGMVCASFVGYRDATSWAVTLIDSTTPAPHVQVWDNAGREYCFDSKDEDDMRLARHWRDYYRKAVQPAQAVPQVTA